MPGEKGGLRDGAHDGGYKTKKNAKEKMKRKVEVVRWFGDVSCVGVTKGSVLVSRPTACVLYSCEYQLFRTDKSLLQKSEKKLPKTQCVSLSLPSQFQHHFTLDLNTFVC